MKKSLLILAACTTISVSQFLPNIVFADAVEGDVVLTLGEDLSIAQKEKVLDNLEVTEDDVSEIIYVSNDEEHQYLGSYIPSSQIGTKAISSAKIEFGEKGSGIVVETENISYITPEMYTNALATAGVTDSKITVTAPFNVSGTGALTGVIKAYEETTGKSIPEEQKQAANEEMVLTADLASDDAIGSDKAVEFVQKVKEDIAETKATSDDDIRSIILAVAKEMGIELNEEQVLKFIDFFKTVKDLDIDWSKVNDTISAVKEKWNDFANDEETKGLIDSITNFFSKLGDWLLSLFS